MKFTTTEPAEPVTDAANSCCLRRADWEWALDDIMIAVKDGRPIPTTAIDRLPPWRAVLYVTVALRAGGRLADGTLEQLTETVQKVGSYAQPGWWRAELGLEPVDPMAPAAQVSLRDYQPPTGWKVVRRPANERPA